MLTRRKLEAIWRKELLETSALTFSVFMAISKRNGFKAIFMRQGRGSIVCLCICLPFIQFGLQDKETSMQKTSLEVSVMIQYYH